MFRYFRTKSRNKKVNISKKQKKTDSFLENYKFRNSKLKKYGPKAYWILRTIYDWFFFDRITSIWETGSLGKTLFRC